MPLKWDLPPPSKRRAKPKRNPVQAIALGDGCVEAWAVPDPDASDVNGEQASSSASSSPRVVRPAPAFVGITTPAQGPTLTLDWCGRADDGDRLAGATEGGCVVLWRVPRKGSGSGAGGGRDGRGVV